ncbi:MAG: response regulator [Phycisphaerae bacterium]|jgi:DNA-binding response OmpR family regulator
MQEPTHILVIDDDATIRLLLQNALVKKGFKVFSAANGRDGIDLAKSEEIDIVLLDWMMPEMDGMEVLVELKRNTETMHIPVLMLTCKDDSKDIDLAISRGAIDYIVKPFNTYEVPDIVQKHLEKIHHGEHTRKQGFFSKLLSHH